MKEPSKSSDDKVVITPDDIDDLATALDALPTDWHTASHGHKYIEVQENNVTHKYVIGTVCKGKSRINFPQ